MDRWAGVKLCGKTRLKCKKGTFTTQAETTHVKMPREGQNDMLPLQCDSGKSREFIEKITQKHRFRNNSTTSSETIPKQHVLDLEVKKSLKCL